MTSITKLSLKDIRCFAGEQTVTLPRITLLVGENSTGKTTFLACCSVFAHLACNQERSYNPFKIDLIDMGTFETIARQESDSFILGGCVDGVDMRFEFASKDGTLCEQRAMVKPQGMPELQFERVRSAGIWKLTSPSFAFNLDSNNVSYRQFSQWLGMAVRYQQLPYGGDIGILKKVKRYKSSDSEITHYVRLVNHLTKLSSALPASQPKIRTISPQILSPRREYTNHPLFPGGFDRTHELEVARERIARAGSQLKLFSDIDIQREPGGGYALEVTVFGRRRNIVDVGFGVHCVLPMLKLIGEDSGATILMQQPETHLHPMAQALLAQFIAESEGRYVIETHADHIINRLCICVRKGEVTPGDVEIFWFEQRERGNDVVIHEIKIDEEGNLIDAPANYREFFERETEEFLGF